MTTIHRRVTLHQSDSQKNLAHPFLKAWSLGIAFDECNNQELHKNYAQKLRLLVHTSILKKPPALIKLDAFSDKDNLSFLARNNISQEGISYASEKIDDYQQTIEETISLYNYLESPYKFEVDCQTKQYARHIQMFTLSRLFGLNLVIEKLENDKYSKNLNTFYVKGAPTVYARLEGVKYDPKPEKYPNLWPNQVTEVIHDGDCGYHTFLLLLKESWSSLKKEERERFLTLKSKEFKKFNQKDLILENVSEYANKKTGHQYAKNASMFNVRAIGYSVLFIAITTLVYLIGWASFLAMLATPQGVIALTAVLFCILMIEAMAAHTNNLKR